MRETLELLRNLEVSREPRIRQKLGRLNARVRLLERELVVLHQRKSDLLMSRNSVMNVLQSGQPLTGQELHSGVVRSGLIDQQIEQASEEVSNGEQQLVLAKTRAQSGAAHLSKCLRRQFKLEQAIKPLNVQESILQDRLEEAQGDQLSAMRWLREVQ